METKTDGDHHAIRIDIFIEMQQPKSKKKDKSQDLIVIRQSVIHVLHNDTDLHNILKSNYTIEIIEVESNPFQIKIKVKD